MEPFTMDIVFQLLRPDLLIIAVVLWCIGSILKKNPSFKNEWQIPFILLGVGIIMTFCYMAFGLGEGISAKVITESFMQGILVASLAVFSNEAIKQITYKKEQDEA